MKERPSVCYVLYKNGALLKYRTRDLKRTLEKVAGKAAVVYIRCGYGWIELKEGDLRDIERGRSIEVPWSLEPPTFRGLRAYRSVKISPKWFEGSAR